MRLMIEMYVPCTCINRTNRLSIIDPIPHYFATICTRATDDIIPSLMAYWESDIEYPPVWHIAGVSFCANSDRPYQTACEFVSNIDKVLHDITHNMELYQGAIPYRNNGMRCDVLELMSPLQQMREAVMKYPDRLVVLIP